MNAQKKKVLSGISQQGTGPNLSFQSRAGGFPSAEQQSFKRESLDSSVTGREYTLKREENTSGISSKERRENNDEGRKEKRKNMSFESIQESAFRERNWPVACSEAKAVARVTYLYLCNLAYRNLLLSQPKIAFLTQRKITPPERGNIASQYRCKVVISVVVKDKIRKYV